MTIKRLKAILLCIAIFIGLFLGYRQVLPPAAPKNIDERPITLAEADDDVDFRLMLTHIRKMASEVRSVGSPGLARSQAYLKARLDEMGFDYTIDNYMLSVEEAQELIGLWFGYYGDTDLPSAEEIRERAGLGEDELMELNNIMVHIDAPNTDETIIFMAHTDSVIEGPGAFDDTVSVAALLEGLRALRGKETARDILFLFTGGEEQGLLGSAKFILDHPEYRQHTRLVVNLEARGNSGVLILFQSTDNNLGLIETYRQAAPYPFSTSFATSIYKTMPNDTDLTHFIHAGYPGINFAAIDGSHVYHTPLDNYDTFNRDSALHYLNTTVGLVRHLSLHEELNLEAGQDSVHFPFFPGKLAIIPESLAKNLSHLALALTLLCLFFLLRRKKTELPRLLLTMGVQILILVLSAGIIWCLLEAIYFLHYRYDFFWELLVSEKNFGMQSNVLFIIFLLALTACAAFLLRFIRKRKTENSSFESRYSHLIGILLLPALLSEVCVWCFPAGSYLFFLPVLAGLSIIAVRLLLPKLTLIFALLSIIFLLYTPPVYVLHSALLIYNAYITLPVAMFSLTLISGIIEFAR